MVTDIKDYREFIINRRRELGITITELADRVGVTNQAIHYFENGTTFFTFENLVKVCEALEIDLIMHAHPRKASR